MKKSEFRQLVKEELRTIILEEKAPKQVLNEMATFYKIKGDPEKSKQVVKLLKGRVAPKSTAMEVLDALEQNGEADLYILKKAREAKLGKEIPIQAYNTQDLKAILENPAVEKYVEKSKSPSTPGGTGGRKAANVDSIEDFLAAQGL